MHAHRDNPDLVYVLKFITEEEDLPLEAFDDIIHWCRTNSANPDAVWRLSRAWHLFDYIDLASQALYVAELVLAVAWTASTVLPRPIRRGIANLLTLLAANPGIRDATDTLRLTRLTATWLRSPDPLPDGLMVLPEVDLSDMVWHVGHALRHGLLDANKDRAILARFVRWAGMIRAPKP